MAREGEPIAERVRALEEKMLSQARDTDRIVALVTDMTKDHFESVRESVSNLSKHITAETDRWIHSFRWIAYALLAVAGGGIVSNNKVMDKIIEVLLK